MKKVVVFKAVKPEGHITLDMHNPEVADYFFGIATPYAYDTETNEPLYFPREYNLPRMKAIVPMTHIYESISLKHFVKVPAELLEVLTIQYLHGCTISLVDTKQGFAKDYLNPHATFLHRYSFQELDLTKPIPRSLAKFELCYAIPGDPHGARWMTYREAISSLNTTKYLPNAIWTALDRYSQMRIKTCKVYNRGNFTSAELWYKQLIKDCKGIKCQIESPNQKSYYEAVAELQFDKDCKIERQSITPLTEREKAFLYEYAPIYGVEIPTFKYRINTRQTPHGYTEEPERVYYANSSSDWSRIAYDGRNASKGTGASSRTRRSLVIHEYESDRLLREAYDSLMWLITNMGDDALMPNWKRCPVCGKLYRESEGCECGYCEAVEFIPADNLLYGIASTYEDHDAMHTAYGECLE